MRFLRRITRGKRGITPIIAIILLLMMTVAVAGAAFFWLTRIQGQLQGGVESFQGRIFETIASSVNVIDSDFSSNELTIFFHNTGNTEVPVKDSDTFPTTTWILRDSNQVSVCSSDWSGVGNNTDCTTGCGGSEIIGVGEIKKVVLDLAGSSCSLTSFSDGTVFSFVVDFSGVTTTAGSFVK